VTWGSLPSLSPLQRLPSIPLAHCRPGWLLSPPPRSGGNRGLYHRPRARSTRILREKYSDYPIFFPPAVCHPTNTLHLYPAPPGPIASGTRGSPFSPLFTAHSKAQLGFKQNPFYAEDLVIRSVVPRVGVRAKEIGGSPLYKNPPFMKFRRSHAGGSRRKEIRTKNHPG
jgi:hypothetical protein